MYVHAKYTRGQLVQRVFFFFVVIAREAYHFKKGKKKREKKNPLPLTQSFYDILFSYLRKLLNILTASKYIFFVLYRS